MFGLVSKPVLIVIVIALALGLIITIIGAVLLGKSKSCDIATDAGCAAQKRMKIAGISLIVVGGCVLIGTVIGIIQYKVGGDSLGEDPFGMVDSEGRILQDPTIVRPSILERYQHPSMSQYYGVSMQPPPELVPPTPSKFPYEEPADVSDARAFSRPEGSDLVDLSVDAAKRRTDERQEQRQHADDMAQLRTTLNGVSVNDESELDE